MVAILSFRDLEVCKKALRAAKNIFEVSTGFPADERFSLTDQIRRASRATAALMPEAWARRRYRKAFISRLVEAMGEAMETQAWLDHARTCRYLSQE